MRPMVRVFRHVGDDRPKSVWTAGRIVIMVVFGLCMWQVPALARTCAGHDFFNDGAGRLKSVCDAMRSLQPNYRCNDDEETQVWLNDAGLPELQGSGGKGGALVYVGTGDIEFFADPDGSRPVRPTRPVLVGQKVSLLDYDRDSGDPRRSRPDGRGKVQLAAGEEVWTDLSSLICAVTPLKDDETGLSLRVVALGGGSTAQELRIPTYIDPELTPCSDRCPEISVFQVFHVYERVPKEEPEALLVSERARLTDEGSGGSGLFWLSTADVADWQSPLMVRPHPDIMLADDMEQPGVCLYESLESARNARGDDCQSKLLGGVKWDYTSLHAPVIDNFDDNRIYKAVIAIDERTREVDTDRRLDAGTTGYYTVDVFFLIDGSRSMAQHRDAIVNGFIDNVEQALRAKLAEGGKYRIGFRVFNDTEKGVARWRSTQHGVPLSDTCDGASAETLRAQNRQAVDELRAVGFFDRLDDYHEDLYGGLLTAGRDMRNCPDNVKILFVIGDAGYEAQWHRARGHPPYTMDIVMRAYRSWTDDGRVPDRLIPVFVRAPYDPPARNPKDYRRAYESFGRDARSFLANFEHGLFFDGVPSGGAADDIVTTIIGTVNTWINPQGVRQVERNLESGESVTDAVALAQAALPDTMPAQFVDFLRKDLCRRLPDRCEQDSVSIVAAAYMRTDRTFTHPEADAPVPRLLPELWIPYETAEAVVDRLKRFHENTEFLLDTRGAVTHLMETLLDQLLPEPLPSRADPDAFQAYLQRGLGIPLRQDSPFLGYTISEFNEMFERNPAQGKCELRALRAWIDDSRSIIEQIIRLDDNTTVAIDDSEVANDLICPGRTVDDSFCGSAGVRLSAKGRRTPLVEIAVRQKRIFDPVDIPIHQERYFGHLDARDRPWPGHVKGRDAGSAAQLFVTMPQCFAP